MSNTTSTNLTAIINDIFEQLFKTLNAELSLYTTLETLIDSQKHALISLQRETLESIIGEEGHTISEIQRMAQTRLKLLAIIAKYYNIDPEKISLKEIIWKIPEPHKSKILDLRGRLLNKISSISKVNNLNIALINQSTEHIKSFLDIILTSGNSADTYSPNGKNKDNKSTYHRLIDHVA